MSDQPSFEGEEQLTVKDRLNHPYLLAKSIIAYIDRMPKSGRDEDTEKELAESVNALLGTIPDAWKKMDQDFQKEIEKAKRTIIVDVRPLVAGNTRMSMAACVKLGLPVEEKEETINHKMVYQACINLLNRMEMLAKKNYVEELEKINFDQAAQEMGMYEIENENPNESAENIE